MRLVCQKMYSIYRDWGEGLPRFSWRSGEFGEVPGSYQAIDPDVTHFYFSYFNDSKTQLKVKITHRFTI